ncbi:radical SAM/SPASM domain-containing protein [Empedobacter sp. UBA5036]|uniref:radical SAM/SPASM domain-containing protein n=2 Tax=unclassified Empedobacter TaxID=2643773 RepID=UPI0025BE2ACA|nr:radical SAM protein [Empedobacter sp. UBA5036]
MRFSMYNLFLPFERKMLAYNSVNDKFMLLEYALYDLLQAAINESNPIGLQEIHPDYFNALLQNGFIVDKEKDEYAEIREIIINTDQDESFFNIIINPTMNCNFKCWYCYENHIKSSKMSEDIINKVYKLIDNVTSKEKTKNLYLSWFGGEPLLYFDKVMIPILEYANHKTIEKNIGFESDITTNGYLINQKMIDNFIKYNITHNQITLDGHRDLHNTVRNVNEKRGSYDEIINNVKLLCKNNISTTLRINFTNETLNTVLNVIEDISDISNDDREWLEISFHQVWQTKEKGNLEMSEKLKAIKKTFRDNNFFVSGNTRDNIRNSCYADKTNEVVINYNGDAFKCTARDFTKNNREGVLQEDGTIDWFEKNSTRLMAKLNNKPCQTCPILPLCGSGCSQVAFENNGEDYCVYDFDIEKKKEVVKEHFIECMNL